jgi:hypothetical protein
METVSATAFEPQDPGKIPYVLKKHAILSSNGVRPSRWTGLRYGFGKGAGVAVFELAALRYPKAGCRRRLA